LGGDLGSAIKNFKDSMQEGKDSVDDKDNVIEHDETTTQQREQEKDKSSR
jgi:sec-independent protein translocase protein TatA